MNKDKQILILTQRIELLEKQNEDLRAENQEMKLQVEESKRFANMPNNVLNRTIKNVRQEEAKFKALIAETQEIKKELETIKKTKEKIENATKPEIIWILSKHVLEDL